MGRRTDSHGSGQRPRLVARAARTTSSSGARRRTGLSACLPPDMGRRTDSQRPRPRHSRQRRHTPCPCPSMLGWMQGRPLSHMWLSQVFSKTPSFRENGKKLVDLTHRDRVIMKVPRFREGSPYCPYGWEGRSGRSDCSSFIGVDCERFFQLDSTGLSLLKLDPS
eukprot:2854120-Prymnesium_polylepis.1